jgi:hypothetical protein
VGLDRFLRIHSTQSRKLLAKVFLKQQMVACAFDTDPSREVKLCLFFPLCLKFLVYSFFRSLGVRIQGRAVPQAAGQVVDGHAPLSRTPSRDVTLVRSLSFVTCLVSKTLSASVVRGLVAVIRKLMTTVFLV